MKTRIPIVTWQAIHAAVPLRFKGMASAESMSDGQGARAVDSIEGESTLRITLNTRSLRPIVTAPEQVRKALRPPWWA